MVLLSIPLIFLAVTSVVLLVISKMTEPFAFAIQETISGILKVKLSELFLEQQATKNLCSSCILSADVEILADPMMIFGIFFEHEGETQGA